MTGQIIQMWNRCSDRQPVENGNYILYLPEPHNMQVIAEFRDGVWYIPQVFQETKIMFGPGLNCLWTYGTRDPDEETINSREFM